MEIQKLQEETLNKCQEYYDEITEWLGLKGFIWLRNDETGQMMLYTRGEYTSEFMDFIAKLK